MVRNSPQGEGEREGGAGGFGGAAGGGKTGRGVVRSRERQGVGAGARCTGAGGADAAARSTTLRSGTLRNVGATKRYDPQARTGEPAMSRRMVRRRTARALRCGRRTTIKGPVCAERTEPRGARTGPSDSGSQRTGDGRARSARPAPVGWLPPLAVS